MAFRYVYFILIISGINSYSALAQHTPDTEALADYLEVIHIKKGFSGEVLVANGRNILFHRAVGMASLEHNVPLEKGAVYRIASVTKTFTGALVLMTQEEGKLRLEDKAADYIGDLSPVFSAITVEQLLTHRSGLPHNEGIKDYWPVKSKYPMTREQVISEINGTELLFTPGTQMQYSSLGYCLLACILEEVYNKPFTDILAGNILQKLEMTETGRVNNLDVIPNMATGYHLAGDDSLVGAPYRDYSMLKGAGDMYATATDLLKWHRSFLNDTLLTKRIMASGQELPRAAADEEAYGYGWYIDSRERLRLHHGGGTWGYSSHTALYPDDGVSIIILSNVSALPVSSIAEDIEKMVFGEPFALPVLQTEVKNNQIDSDRYTGQYLSDANNMLLTITAADEGLYAKLGGNPAFRIYAAGDHRYFGKKIEIDFTFITNGEVVTGLQAVRMGRRFTFTKQGD